MTKPMSYAAFVRALRAEGCTVVEVTTDGKSPAFHNRNHKGPWGPVHGVQLHHTVTKGTKNTVEICRKGYAGLPGPLCHGVIAKNGTIYVVGYGRANHAGRGDGDVHRAVVAESYATRPPHPNQTDTDGNTHYYGYECENLGDGKDPWPAAQLLAVERAAAAVCRHHGWSEKSVIGHLEWQPGKVDPRGFTMPSMRARIAKRLKSKPGAAQQPPAGGAQRPAPSAYDRAQDRRITELTRLVQDVTDGKESQGS